MSIQSAVLGFPRIGAKREVKKATEAYWAGKIQHDELLKVAKEQRLARWQTLKDQGVDVIPSCVLGSPLPTSSSAARPSWEGAARCRRPALARHLRG